MRIGRSSEHTDLACDIALCIRTFVPDYIKVHPRKTELMPGHTQKKSTFLPLSCDSDIDLWTWDLGFVCDTLPSEEKHLYQIILKFIQRRWSYSPHTAKCPSFLPFDLWLWPWPLCYRPGFCLRHSPSLEEHLCQVILKFI